MEFGGVSKEFRSSDKMARQKITEILAKDGYLPEMELKLARKNFQREIEKAKEETESWKRIARQRLDELERWEKSVREAQETAKRQKNQELDKKFADLIAKFLSRV